MAGKYSLEQQAIYSLIAGAPIEFDETKRFDPAPYVNLAGEEQEIALKRTATFPVISNFGAPACVAVFGEQGPGLDQSMTDDMIHHNCDVGVLVRRPDLRQPAEHIEAIRATQQLGLKPSTAWIVELLVPGRGNAGTFVRSGHVRAFAPIGV